MQSSKKQIVEAINAAFERNSIDDFLAYATPDLEWTMVGMGTWSSADTIRTEWTKMTEHQKPNFMKINTTHLIEEGDTVACEGVVHTKTKEGKDEEAAFVDVYRFEGDKVRELTSYVVVLKQG